MGSNIRLPTAVATVLGLGALLACMVFVPMIFMECQRIWEQLQSDMNEFRLLSDDLWKDMMQMSTADSRRFRRQYGQYGSSLSNPTYARVPNSAFATGNAPGPYRGNLPTPGNLPRSGNLPRPASPGYFPQFGTQPNGGPSNRFPGDPRLVPGTGFPSVKPSPPGFFPPGEPSDGSGTGRPGSPFGSDTPNGGSSFGGRNGPKCICRADNKCPVGRQGLKGRLGEAGSDGLPGPDGPDGIPAEDAIVDNGFRDGKCYPCPMGPPGKKGRSGKAGSRGMRGAAGHGGMPGNNGQPGSSGPHGAIGPKGRRGSKGARGERGAPHMYPRSLAGPQGDPGYLGPIGDRGVPGRDALNGESGPPGPAGPPGSKGKDGGPGPTGATGPVGPHGRDANYCSCPPHSKKSR